VVRGTFGLRFPAKYRLHSCFQVDSRCAITLELARALSRDPIFKDKIKAAGLTDLEQLADHLRESRQPFYLEAGKEETALRAFDRFLAGEGRSELTTIISTLEEMQAIENLPRINEFIVEGEISRRTLRSAEDHFRVLREEGRGRELIDFAEGDQRELALTAIDELAALCTPEVQRALGILSHSDDSTVAVRVMHSLVIMGHDLTGRIMKAGLEISGLEEERGELIFIFRSLALLKRADHAYIIFSRLKKTQQQKMILDLLADKSAEVRDLAAVLNSVR